MHYRASYDCKFAALDKMKELAWNDLRIAVAIGEAGSPAGAARQLGVNATTVLRRLELLERHLGTRLFDRVRLGYTPTDAGFLVLERARFMHDQAREIERQVLGQDRELSGPLRVATAFVIMDHLLPKPLADFARAFPGIKVEVVENSVLQDLRRRNSIDQRDARVDADVAIRMTARVDERLVGRQVGISRTRVYALRGAATLPQEVTPLQTLVREAPWVAFENDSIRRQHDVWMHRELASAQVRVRVDTFTALAAMLSTGVGIGVLPTCVAETHPEFVPVSAIIEELTIPVWMLTHPDLRYTARVRAFMQHVGNSLTQRLEATEARDRNVRRRGSGTVASDHASTTSQAEAARVDAPDAALKIDHAFGTRTRRR
jgi:DNA-binding transcriptional LysR family regulator